MNRRKLLGFGALGLTTTAVGGCAYVMTRPVQALPAAPGSPPPVSVDISPRIRLHMIQTGWVAVKEEHRAYSGPVGLRLPAIMASRNWTEWMPITAFVIEHPEGIIVVDTGETANIADPAYASCDPITGMFYRRNLQFSLSAEDEIGVQMRKIGLAPDRVARVVMTHLHSDHMGGLTAFRGKRVCVSQAAANGHTGALMCRVPREVELVPVGYGDGAKGAFSQSANLTEDGAISIVPTPGHATGHQSVVIEGNGKSVCLVGDAAFSMDQISSGETGGIVENHADSVRSATRLKRQHEHYGTLMLPTHDPGNAARLRQV